MSYSECFSQEFSKLSPENQERIIEMMINLQQQSDSDDVFSEINYRKLYHIMFSEVDNVINIFRKLLLSMEEKHMRTGEKVIIIDLTDSKYDEGRFIKMRKEEQIREEAYNEAYERVFNEEYDRRIDSGEEPCEAEINAKIYAKDCAEAASDEAVQNNRLLPKDD